MCRVQIVIVYKLKFVQGICSLYKYFYTYLLSTHATGDTILFLTIIPFNILFTNLSTSIQHLPLFSIYVIKLRIQLRFF